MHATLAADASMLALSHDEFRMRSFARRCQILFGSHPTPIARCGALALESLDHAHPLSREPRRGGDGILPAWIAMGDRPRWISFWNHLLCEDEALCRWAIDCIRLLCLDLDSAPHASPHALSCLSAYASLPCAELSKGLAEAIAGALRSVLFHQAAKPDPSRPPSELDARLCQSCLLLLSSSKAPGAAPWMLHLLSALPDWTRASHGPLCSLIEQLELEADCADDNKRQGGQRL